jgi:Ca2+-binding RTX toxin-like protein
LKRDRKTAISLALVIFGAGILTSAGSAYAATPRCMGKKATIVSNAGEINGTRKDDVIVSKGNSSLIDSKGGDDTICAGGGIDFVFGRGGNDKMNGGGDSDYLLGERGNDTYNGGNDLNTDTAVFFNSLNPINANMVTGVVSGEGSDKLKNIDGLWGTDLNDTIVGTDDTDFVFGLLGNDSINLGGGLDLVTPGEGDDVVDGGDEDGENFNIDIVYFETETGVIVDLQSESAIGEGDDTITGFESVNGSPGDDTITGDQESNILFGGQGNDTMDGGGGPAVDYAGYWFAAGPVNANLMTGSAVGQDAPGEPGSGDGTDTLSSFEGLLGTIDGDDTLTGNNQNNYLDGDLGDDTLDGQGGDDLFLGGEGDDIMTGGAGNFDMADYFCVCDLFVDLGAGTATGHGSDTLSGIEAVGAADGDDTLIGDGNDNIFFGWGGNDIIQGMAGNDELDGGIHSNQLDGGDGTDACARGTIVTACESTPDTIADHPLRTATALVSNLRRNF